VRDEWEAIRECIHQGSFAIEWKWGKPELQFWPGEPVSDIVGTIDLRDVLMRELQVAVPLEFFGNPMDFVGSKEWVHAQQVRLLQGLLRAYDQWERLARR
jgi:hypothetical protein